MYEKERRVLLITTVASVGDDVSYPVCLQHPVCAPVVTPVVIHDHQPHPAIVRLLVRAEEQAVVEPGLLARVHIVERSLKPWLCRQGEHDNLILSPPVQ